MMRSVEKRHEQLLADAVSELFMREMPRYENLRDLLLADITELTSRGPVDGIPKCTVQSRVKGAKSLGRKLEARMLRLRNRRADDSELDRVLSDAIRELRGDPRLTERVLPGLARRTLDAVPDLVGIRLLPYDQADLHRLNENLERLWASGAQDSPFQVRAAPLARTPGDHYRATHYRISYQPSGSDEWWEEREFAGRIFLRGVTAEVQTTTMLQHVLNELNHDFVYKPLEEWALDPSQEAELDELMNHVKQSIEDAQGRVDSITVLARRIGIVPGDEDQESQPAGPHARTKSGGAHGDDSNVTEKPRLANDQLLVFTAPTREEGRVRQWAKETGFEWEAIHARWEADRGRLKWEMNPADYHTASGLAKLIRFRSGVTKNLQDVDGASYWTVVLDDGSLGHRLSDVSSDPE